MAGALSRAMEKMGWRGIEGDLDDDYYYEDEQEEVESVAPFARPEIISSRPATSSYDKGRGLDKARIRTIAPTSYNDARFIGESFRDNIPVIMDLTNLSDAEARRIIDFSAGLTFGLRGSIEAVTSRVILLSPESVKVEGQVPRSASHNLPFDQD
ncbi:MAG: cell division protein SepF [Actinomycetaceae bacterium]|nr:cell division protein SepF [Actinomycetaceae bacterium]